MNMIALNKVLNTMLVTQFQLMTIGHLKSNNVLNKLHNRIQGTGYDPNNPYMNLPNQEWRKNTGGGLSSGEIQTRDAILNGTYEVEDAQQNLMQLIIMNKNTGTKYFRVARLPLLFYLLGGITCKHDVMTVKMAI